MKETTMFTTSATLQTLEIHLNTTRTVVSADSSFSGNSVYWSEMRDEKQIQLYFGIKLEL